MAYIITKESFRRFLSALGDSRAHNLPRYLVLSEEEESLYHLEPLERWLSRHNKKEKDDRKKGYTADAPA